MTLMGMGFTYSEAMDMTLPEYRRYASIKRAWSIPEERRVVRATKEQMDAEWAHGGDD